MLRKVLIVAGLAFLAAAAWFWLHGASPGAIFVLVVWGALITLGTIYERSTYKPLAEEPPGSGWVETGERFTDPETGKLVSVFYRPTDGERKYVKR